MNKDKLVDVVSAKLGSTKSEAERAINAILDEITSALQKGDEVSLTGFGIPGTSIANFTKCWSSNGSLEAMPTPPGLKSLTSN